MASQDELDAPLVRVAPEDCVSARDFCGNILITGITGSGKSSGSGAAIRTALLRYSVAGSFPTGGIVLCAKEDEVQTWREDARKNGRENSLIVFGPDGEHGFNFIDAELSRRGADGVGAVVEYLLCICEATKNGGGQEEQNFWQDSIRNLLRKVLPILYSAYGTVRLEDVTRFIQGAPQSPEEFADDGWKERSFWFKAMAAARKTPAVPMAEEDYSTIGNWWINDFARLDNKTRSNITISLSTALDRFSSGPLKRAFCGKTTFTMEATWHGAIIVVAFPALTMNEDGVIANKLLKLAWQRCVLTRNSQQEAHRRALTFCYADECQLFLLPEDAKFLSVSRQSRAASIFLTQSLPAIVHEIGGKHAKEAAEMLTANFGTKVFHCADVETARWGAETCGKDIQLRGNYSQGTNSGISRGTNMGESENWGSSSGVSFSNDGKGNGSTSINSGTSSGAGTSRGVNRGRSSGESFTAGQSEQIDYDIQPSFFSRQLKTGGPANGMEVTGIWHQAGRTFRATGTSFLHVRFKQ